MITIKNKTLLIDLTDVSDSVLLSLQDVKHCQESTSTKEYRIEPAQLSHLLKACRNSKVTVREGIHKLKSHPNKWLMFKVATDFDQKVVKKGVIVEIEVVKKGGNGGIKIGERW